MSLISTISHLPTPAKIAIGVGVAGAAVGIGVLLTGCASPKDPADFTKGLFADFDANPSDGGINRGEATKQRLGRVQSQDVLQYRLGNVEVYDRQTIQRSWTDSVLKAVNVADTNGDAVAGWDELKTLANKFDKNGDGVLKGGEQNDFKREYGPQETNSQWHILAHQTVFRTIDNNNYPDPNYPRGTGSGGNSPGDSYGSGGHGGVGNSPGDSGSVPRPVPVPVPGPGSSSGNGGGDSYSPGSGSGSRPTVPSGSHANPTDKDF